MAVDGVRFPANPLACNHYKIGLSVKEHRKTARRVDLSDASAVGA